MSEAEHRNIDSILAFHGAPTLLGVKCANLVSFNRERHVLSEYLQECSRQLCACGLRAAILCKCRERSLVYIYNEKMLGAWLSMPEVQAFLEEYGYTSDMDTDEKLRTLAQRMSCGSFPHEIGAFLGYPLGDIRGFISNKGKNCLLCGYWKVYENKEKAQQTFDIYDRCRLILSDRINRGLELFQAVK